MKKFSFPLQKLLNYKGQMLENERTMLMEMYVVLNRMTDELQTMEEELIRRSAEYNQKIAQGTTPMEITIYTNYRRMLEHSIEQKKSQIALQRNVISKQMDKVRDAKVEVSTLEKLREKKLEEYRYLSAKADEQFIEEFVSNTKAVAQAG